jgi:hypothetical protein
VGQVEAALELGGVKTVVHMKTRGFPTSPIRPVEVTREAECPHQGSRTLLNKTAQNWGGIWRVAPSCFHWENGSASKRDHFSRTSSIFFFKIRPLNRAALLLSKSARKRPAPLILLKGHSLLVCF